MKKLDQENPRDHSLHLLSTNHRHETKQFVAAWICPEMGYTVCIKSAYPILASVGNGKRYVSSYLSTQDFPRCGGFRGFQFLLGKPVPNVFSLSSTRRVSIGWCATGCRGGQPRRIAMKVGDGSSNKFRLRNQIKKSSTALIFFRTTWYTWAPRIWMVNQLTAIFSTKTAIIHRWYTMNRPLSDTYIVSQTEDSLSWSWPSYGYGSWFYPTKSVKIRNIGTSRLELGTEMTTLFLDGQCSTGPQHPSYFWLTGFQIDSEGWKKQPDIISIGLRLAPVWSLNKRFHTHWGLSGSHQKQKETGRHTQTSRREMTPDITWHSVLDTSQLHTWQFFRDVKFHENM